MSTVTTAVLEQLGSLPAVLPAVDNPKADFSDTPWWLSARARSACCRRWPTA